MAGCQYFYGLSMKMLALSGAAASVCLHSQSVYVALNEILIIFILAASA